MWSATLIAVWRIVNILSIAVNMALFDGLRRKSPHVMASAVRTIILTSINYIEVIACFGVAYAAFPSLLKHADDRFADALYFSAITQLTIGYGDVVPSGIGRLVAVIQGMFGLWFGLLILSRFVNALPRFRELVRPE